MLLLAPLKERLGCNRIHVTKSLVYFWREKLCLMIFEASHYLQTFENGTYLCT